MNAIFPMKCPVCTHDIRKVLFKSENRHGRSLQEPSAEFDLYQCTSCGLIGLPNVETDDHYYKNYYPQGYHSHPALSLIGRAWNIFASFSLGRKINMLKRYISLPCSLLDIGCGDGGFLKHLDPALFAAHGLEPVKEAVEAAQAAKLQVTQGDILKGFLLPEKYDVVTLWHVFEHIKDPVTALNRIHTLLRPGGILVMSMPNTNSLAARLGGKYWFHLDSPRHLWLYHEKNIRTLLASTNFEVECCRYLPLEFPLDLFWSIKICFVGKLLLPIYPLIKLFDRQNMMIIARKR